MKRLLFAAVALAAVAAVLGMARAGGGAGANLAPDPGFETDPNVSYYAWGTAAFSWATDAVRNGTHSVKIVSTQPAGALSRWMTKTTTIPATAGVTYSASVYLKTAGGAAVANLSLDFWDATGAYVGVTADSAQLTGTHDWTFSTVSVKAPPRSAYVRIEFRLTGPGTLWADDVSLTADTGGPATPTISGEARQGQALTTSLGSWPAGATLHDVLWQRCAADGSSCTSTPGHQLGNDRAAYGTEPYVLTAADVGHRIRAEVELVVNGQLARADSNETAVVTEVDGLPVNTDPPQIGGPTAPDETLSATTGSWTGAPTSYTYQWFSCAWDVDYCSPLDGDTSATLHLPLDDGYTYLQVLVTATNAAGSVQASAASRFNPKSDFIVFDPPRIVGLHGAQPSYTVGATLEAVHPSWNTTTPWASIQDPVLWLRCGTDGRDCTTVQPGGLDYQVASGDVGHRLRVVFEESRLRTADGTMIGAASAPTPVITGS